MSDKRDYVEAGRFFRWLREDAGFDSRGEFVDALRGVFGSTFNYNRLTRLEDGYSQPKVSHFIAYQHVTKCNPALITSIPGLLAIKSERSYAEAGDFFRQLRESAGFDSMSVFFDALRGACGSTVDYLSLLRLESGSLEPKIVHFLAYQRATNCDPAAIASIPGLLS